MVKQRCAECGCWVYVQKGTVIECSECGKPCFIEEEPKEE